MSCVDSSLPNEELSEIKEKKQSEESANESENQLKTLYSTNKDLAREFGINTNKKEEIRNLDSPTKENLIVIIIIITLEA